MWNQITRGDNVTLFKYTTYMTSKFDSTCWRVDDDDNDPQLEVGTTSKQCLWLAWKASEFMRIYGRNHNGKFLCVTANSQSELVLTEHCPGQNERSFTTTTDDPRLFQKRFTKIGGYAYLQHVSTGSLVIKNVIEVDEQYKTHLILGENNDENRDRSVWKL